MRFAYLILAHTDLAPLGRLIDRLLRDDPADRVLLHYDRGAPVSDAALLNFAARWDGAVRPTARLRCRWGHRSLVEAETLLLRAASELDFDYAHFISGQDWPVAAKADIVAGLTPGTCYLSFEEPPMPERMQGHHWHDRMIGPNAHSTALRYHLSRAVRAAGQKWSRIAGPRGCPFGSDWLKGSAWWSLPRAAADYALPRFEQLVRSGRLRHTLCSDEHVMQTILGYSPFAERLADNRRFINWTPGRSSPDWLTATDEPAIRASDAWFARKLDQGVDPFFLKL